MASIEAANDDDEKNSELIARLLMQDQMRYKEDNPYSYKDDEEDMEDDYVPKAIVKKAKQQAKKKEIEKIKEQNGTGRKRRGKGDENGKVKKQKKPREDGGEWATGKWTDEEEKLFLESLDIFGRDWSKCSKHIKTRDKDAIKSHAQKYFIRLFKDGLPLPTKVIQFGDSDLFSKVQESGAGHTLSGKPLDPNSGAALMYMGLRKKSEEEKEKVADGEDKKEDSNGKKKPIREKDFIDVAEGVEYDESGRTVYSKNRLRNPSINWQSIGDVEDPLTMIKCQKYVGEPGSNCVTSQPFRVEIQSSVLLICDFHSHLATTEIIGFLGGNWNPDTKVVSIQEAFPCKSIATGSDNVNVEMDPQSEVEVLELIKNLGMIVVGWYHSHPVFQPDPSMRDIENQSSHQIVFKDNKHRIEPFVGIIVGPYDIRMPTEESIINWFHVRNSSEEKGQPMFIDHKIIEDRIDDTTLKKISDLVEDYKNFDQRIRFDEIWRYSAPVIGETEMTDQEKKAKLIQPTTRLEKLSKALRYRLPKSVTPEEADSFINKIIETLQNSWGLSKE